MKNTLCELLDQATILGHRKTNKEIAEYLESCGVIVCRQDEILAADVKPVKCGKWIDVTETVVSGKTKDGRELEINIVSGKCKTKDGRELEINIVSGKCSCCQHYAEQVNILPPIMKYSICPNCGALMQDE